MSFRFTLIATLVFYLMMMSGTSFTQIFFVMEIKNYKNTFNSKKLFLLKVVFKSYFCHNPGYVLCFLCADDYAVFISCRMSF